MASTRLRLSHWNSVCDLANKGTQMAQLKKHDGCKFFNHNTHYFPLIRPSMLQPLMIKQCLHPQWPDAFVWTWQLQKAWYLILRVLLMQLIPFQFVMNRCHHGRSNLKSLVNLVMWLNCLSLAAAVYIYATKVWPGFTTFVACWSSPTRERTCLFVPFFLKSQVSTWWWIRCSFSCRWCAFMFLVSRAMPREVGDCVGLSTFSRASGTPDVGMPLWWFLGCVSKLGIQVGPRWRSHLNSAWYVILPSSPIPKTVELPNIE